MNKKGIAPLIWGLFAVVLLGGLFFLTPLGQVFFVSPQSCELTPYDSECICSDFERKIYVPWFGVDRWDCENPDDLLLNPDSETFTEDAVGFVEDYLSRQCGFTCGDISCGDICPEGSTYPADGDDECIFASVGYGVDGERIANVECVRVTERREDGSIASSISPWRMNFFLLSETGTPWSGDYALQDNYCVNAETEEICQPPLNVTG